MMNNNNDTNLVQYEEINGNNQVVISNPSFIEFYKNVSIEKFDDKIITVLETPIDNNDIEIRPDGIIYLPEIKYRRILNKAFGPGAWSLIRLNAIKDDQRKVVFFDGALFIQGRFHAQATGEMKYIEKNENMTWATALEGAKSDCLTRCCKDLGIASNLWDPQFVIEWKKEYTIKVWCLNQIDNKSKKPLWRKKLADPIEIWPWKEITNNNENENSDPKSQKKNQKIDITYLTEYIRKLHEEKYITTTEKGNYHNKIVNIRSNPKFEEMKKHFDDLMKCRVSGFINFGVSSKHKKIDVIKTIIMFLANDDPEKAKKDLKKYSGNKFDSLTMLSKNVLAQDYVICRLHTELKDKYIWDDIITHLTITEKS